ncbi:MAG TPA: translation elongation factor Ts [Thermoanaerobacterales bacterium]|nr:translation elongation factor Ts [Thermoanaerobacterales bacterium]
MITAQQVKELRERTSAGMMDCKKALVETKGNIEEAVKLLREKGLAAASKKSGRATAEGIVDSYVHGEGRIGVLVEVNCETDFVARNDDFRTFVRNIAMQIAASDPKYISKDDVPEEVVENEKEILKTQAVNEGKPEHIAQKIVEGRIGKYFEEVCLIEQPYIRDTDISIGDYIKENIALLGENISIRRFERFEMGKDS